MPSLQKIIVILGPTASGKSDLALDIAEALPGEIISADSMQVYRRMDIGTAKLSLTERRGIAHHMIDICEPDDSFSVADFRSAASSLITEIGRRGRLPIVAGGTGLYIDSLLKPYNFSDSTVSDLHVRQQLKERLASEGSAVLHRELAVVDAEAAARIHPNDSHRLIRALEVWQVSGRPISSFQAEQTAQLPYSPLLIGLTMPREELYQRIEQRVDIMLEEGLVEEVQALLDSGVSRNAASMQGLGYRQISAYLAGETDYETAVALMKRDTRRFAKRQFTWFKRNSAINWFDKSHYREAGTLQRDVLRLIGR